MKRKIITLCTALFALGIHAQISTPMWENFEGSSLVLENITYEGTGSETMGVEENPQKSGINKSEKCFALTATNQHDWWHKLHIARQKENTLCRLPTSTYIFILRCIAPESEMPVKCMFMTKKAHRTTFPSTIQ